MTLTAQNAADLDRILSFLVTESDSAYFPVKEIKNSFFQNEDEEYVAWLFDILKGYYPKVVNQIGVGNLALEEISKSNYTRQFLQNGGFTDLYNREFEKQKKEEDKSTKEYEKLHLEITTLSNQVKDYPETKRLATSADKYARSGLKMSKISIVISIATLVITVTIIFLSRYKVWPFDK